MSGSRLSFLALALMLAAGAGIAAAETADDRRVRQLAGQAGSYAGDVRALLAKGADPNVPDRNGRTAVHGAASISAVETMQALLKAGGNPNRRDKDGNIPLHLASAAAPVTGFVATIRLLLRANADPGITNGEGRTPLHIAVTRHEQPAAVEALLAHGADANRRDRWGSTPLHAALGHNPGWPGWAGSGVPGIVGPLLANGANPLLANGDGLTALQVFVRESTGSGQTASLLLEAGADPDRKYPDGDALLHAAIRSGGTRGKVKVVEALLAGGADPCARDAKRYTPYHIAPEGGAIQYALSRAGGGDLACNKRDGEAAEGGPGEARMMQARTRTNVRSGPGTQHGKVGLLEAGQEVRVTGEAGEWLRIEGPGGGEAFVHASLLVEAGAATIEPEGPSWSVTENQPCQVWNIGNRKLEPFTWSGACINGKASGPGTLTVRGGAVINEGGMRAGKLHGHSTTRFNNGTVWEGPMWTANGMVSGSFDSSAGMLPRAPM